MEDFDKIGGYVLENESILLWIAISVGALFLLLLAFDFIRRRRSSKRYSSRRGGLLHAIKRPFRHAAELRAALKELRRQRADRRKWEEPGRRVRPRRSRPLPPDPPAK